MRIEEYVAQVCEQLSVDPLRRDEIRLEIHTHLRERAEVLAAGGLDRRSADERAIEEFGPPEQVAARLNQTQPANACPRTLPHADFVGALLIYGGVNALIRLLYMIAQTAGGNPGALGAGWLTAVPYSTILILSLSQLWFGIGVLRRKYWARTAALWSVGAVPLLILGEDLADLGSLHSRGITAWAALPNLMIVLLPPVLMTAYVFWALSGSRGRRTAWN